MKDLPSPWQVIPFSPAYLGLEGEPAKRLPPVKDPMGGKLPLTPWLKMKIDDTLFESVARPLAEQGYPRAGAALAAVPATLSDLLIPETYGDVMGAGVIGKGGKGLDNVVDMFAKKKELQAAGKLTDSPWSGMSKGTQSKPSPWTDVDTRNQGLSTLEDVEDYFRKQHGPADGQHSASTFVGEDGPRVPGGMTRDAYLAKTKAESFDVSIKRNVADSKRIMEEARKLLDPDTLKNTRGPMSPFHEAYKPKKGMEAEFEALRQQKDHLDEEFHRLKEAESAAYKAAKKSDET